MKLSGTAVKAAVVGTVVGVAGTILVLAAGGALGRGGLPGGMASAAVATDAGHAGHAAASPAAATAAAKPSAKERWVCPMGDYEGDKPGRCPKCGMKLQKAPAEKPPASDATMSMPAGPAGHDMGSMDGMDGTPSGQTMGAGEHSGHTMGGAPAGPQVASASPAVSPADGQKVKWVCPMGHIVTDKPGACPVCGMKLIKQTVGQAPGQAPAAPGTVLLSPEKQQQIGVRTAEAVVVTVGAAIRAAGKVEMDESRVAHVHTKIEGWIEDLRVNKTGQQVRKGEPLLSIYSPDLVAAQEEYLQALRTEQELGKGGLLPKGPGLAAAAGQRLRNWDFRDSDLAALRRTGAVRRAVVLASPASGVVLEKKAVAGMRVMPGEELFTIADLSTVWVQAQVYETELPYVKVGEAATVQLEALPGRTFRGRIGFIYPTLDPATRTAKVRVVLLNPGMVLKPEMYATVTLAAPAQRTLAIPTEAVLDSGTRQVAFVAKPGGYFEPRVLKLGGYRGDMAIVKAGLKPGERVVTSANFLIDSESQLKSAMESMGMAGHQHR